MAVFLFAQWQEYSYYIVLGWFSLISVSPASFANNGNSVVGNTGLCRPDSRYTYVAIYASTI